MIRLENIHKKFGKLQVLNNISAHLQLGQAVSLIGPNSSGKTTLIKIILGMVWPDTGNLFVNNKVITRDPEYRKDIGYMPQIGRYPDNMKVGHLFKMMKSIRNISEENIDTDLLEKFSIPAIYDKPMRTLSGGTRQKVSAALAFLFNPPILILDEPTAGLDPLSAEILKEKILREKNKNKLILITSHVLSDLEEFTTHVMYLQEGKLQFIKELQDLQEETGEIKLSKAVARIMKGNHFSNDLIEQVLEFKNEGRIN